MQKIKVETHVLGGGAWFAGWLFTIGYANLTMTQIIFGLLIWPYYLGDVLSAAAV